LSDPGAAWLLPQTELTPEKLSDMLQKTERLTLLEKALQAKTRAKTDATAHVVAACEELTR
jgi:UDP-N-acetylglucosamine--N-acetylmuramyl-(pentapeptide) pyrophosphoryl-undecaprenol N-acetylglucosamine transferase